MKKKIFSLCFSLLILLTNPTFAQGPGEPYHPMTANGAKGISRHNHILFWDNPNDAIYNKIYFGDDSILVANSDNSVLIYDGYPSTVYSSASLAIFGYLDFFKNYYWKVVEFGIGDSTNGNIWKFKTKINPTYMLWLEDDFNNGTDNWIITNDGGTCVWDIFQANEYDLPSTSIGNVMAADADECGIFTSTLTSATFKQLISTLNFINIEWDNDWNALDSLDVAYVETSTDNGNSWEIIWSRIGIDQRNSHEIASESVSYNLEVLIRFRTVQPGWDWWWAIDNVKIESIGPLTPTTSPNQLLAFADSTEVFVNLNWGSGFCVDPVSGYEIQRKNGLPLDTSSYHLLTTINGNLLDFVDGNVQPNETYTYRIRTICGPSATIWGNEATAYVPNIVPIELQSFKLEVNGTDVNLLWSTATETNNSGFEILRSTQNDNAWQTIGFVPGFGTSTEVHHYSFVDESVQSGNYNYKLKQIDFDGTFEYSNIIDVTVDVPTMFSLEQNYPNPFNPTTKIKFTIPAVETRHASSLQMVSLKVYDVLGNEVATLVNEQKPAGTYEVEFNVAQSASGGSRPDLSSGISAKGGYASGIYFYQLQADEFLETKKMIILK